MLYRAKKIAIRFLALLVLFVLCSLFLSTAFANETPSATSHRVLKVSCPIQAGFFEVDENGNYSGYSYEYLMKIAQRTGWEYIFITYEPTNENLNAALEELKSGKVDLIPNMVYSDALAESYAFCPTPFGESSFVLIVPNENTALNERTVHTWPKLKVGLNENSTNTNRIFDEFCEAEGIDYEAIYVSNAEKTAMLQSGEIDGLLSKDVIPMSGFKIISRFYSQPFYFASSKDNQPLVDEISQMILDINNTDQFFAPKLHEKYFNFGAAQQPALNAEERDYLNGLGTLRVAILKDHMPLSFFDSATNEYIGILVDIFKMMLASSGLSYEFVPVNTMDEIKRLIKENEIDVFIGFPYDYKSAKEYGALLSSPIFTSPVVRISSLNPTVKNEGILVASNIKTFDNRCDVHYLDNQAEIFDLINRGEYKEAYLNGYLAQHYFDNNNYSNIFYSHTSYRNYEICIAVNRGADLRLISIIERMLSVINSEQVNEIVYKHTQHSRSMSFMELLRRNPIGFLTPILIAAFIIILLLIVLFLRTKMLNKIISMEKSKYQRISSMDRLSSAYNNDAFKQMTSEYLAIEHETPHGAFMVCDIDDFKQINDTYGHLEGDNVIQALGKLLNTVIREGDLCGRLGGDEFMLLLKEVTDIDIITRRCTEIFEKVKTINNQCEITLSMGCVVFTGKISFNELFKAADGALYEVKLNGKSAFKILPNIVIETSANADQS